MEENIEGMTNSYHQGSMYVNMYIVKFYTF